MKIHHAVLHRVSVNPLWALRCRGCSFCKPEQGSPCEGTEARSWNAGAAVPMPCVYLFKKQERRYARLGVYSSDTSVFFPKRFAETCGVTL